MKKNNMLRLASVLLVAVLLSTCALSGVFAYYVSTGTGSDKAQVAKWGLKIQANNDLFAKSYGNTVEASGTYKLVAPGTDNKDAAWVPFTVSGTPEVAFTLSYDATVELTGSWEDDEGKFYCPIAVSVNGTAVTGLDAAQNADAWETLVEEAIGALSAEYDANDDATIVAPSIIWEWAFAGDNVADTQLGDIAAGIVAEKTLPEISVSVTATATQRQ